MLDNKSRIHSKLQSTSFWVCLVFVVSFASRLIIILLYQPVSYSDTSSYRRLAKAVLRGFINYDGTRTPGYPVFLALMGSDQRVWIIQLLLGFATTFLLFYIGWKVTGKPCFGGLIALTHPLNLGHLFYESNLLTETLTTFLLIFSMAGMLVWLLYPRKRNLWLALLIGLTSALTLLVRPLFIYLPFLLLIFLWIGINPRLPLPDMEDLRDDKRSKYRIYINDHPSLYIIAFILPVALLLGGGIFFFLFHYGDWSLTTMTGYHLVQHTGSFFEYVPDEYASLRDTYIQYRDAHIAQYGTQTNTIWEAIPEISSTSGYNFYDLLRVMTKISVQLIMKHPFLYLKSALSGWWMFWRVPFYWSADALRYSWMAGGIKLAVQVERIGLFFINLVFIFASIYFALIEIISGI